jgi:hypothetical protein
LGQHVDHVVVSQAYASIANPTALVFYSAQNLQTAKCLASKVVKLTPHAPTP